MRRHRRTTRIAPCQLRPTARRPAEPAGSCWCCASTPIATKAHITVLKKDTSHTDSSGHQLERQSRRPQTENAVGRHTYKGSMQNSKSRGNKNPRDSSATLASCRISVAISDLVVCATAPTGFETVRAHSKVQGFGSDSGLYALIHIKYRDSPQVLVRLIRYGRLTTARYMFRVCIPRRFLNAVSVIVA